MKHVIILNKLFFKFDFFFNMGIPRTPNSEARVCLVSPSENFNAFQGISPKYPSKPKTKFWNFGRRKIEIWLNVARKFGFWTEFPSKILNKF